MRKISWRKTNYHYPFREHSHSALARCAVLEMLDAFDLCVLLEWHNSIPVGPLIASSCPNSASKKLPRRGIDHLVICVCIYCDRCTIGTGR